MDIEEKTMLKAIRDLRPSFLADGKIDMVEAGWLIKATHGHEQALGPKVRAFVDLLREVRADGIVTPEESARLVAAMDQLLDA